MEERLKFAFTNVNEWLRFAEAKNAAIIAVDGGLAIGILNLLCGAQNWPLVARVYGWMAVMLLGGACLSSLLSFCPQTKIGRRRRPPPADPQRDSLYLYSDVRKYPHVIYLRTLTAAVGPSGGKGSSPPPATGASGGGAAGQPVPLELQLAQQIVTNADIAWWKYGFFRWSLYLTIGALFTPITAILVYLVFDPDRS